MENHTTANGALYCRHWHDYLKHTFVAVCAKQSSHPAPMWSETSVAWPVLTGWSWARIHILILTVWVSWEKTNCWHIRRGDGYEHIPLCWSVGLHAHPKPHKRSSSFLIGWHSSCVLFLSIHSRRAWLPCKSPHGWCSSQAFIHRLRCPCLNLILITLIFCIVNNCHFKLIEKRYTLGNSRPVSRTN